MKLRDYVENNIENIDPDLILEAAMTRKEPEPILIIKGRNDFLKRLSTAAACIVFSVVVIISFILMRNSITAPPADSETEYFTDNDTDTEDTSFVTDETTEGKTETETDTESETEPPEDTEPPQLLPDSAEFWLDRKAVADAMLSLRDAWDDHIRILEACASALHPENGEVTVDGLAMSKNIYLCDSAETYEKFGHDHHIKVQFWSLDFENGTSKYYIIYEYQYVLLGIEECIDSVLYDIEYLFGYIKEDERFNSSVLSKLSEHDPGRDDEVLSVNMSEIPALNEIIKTYPSPLGYSHIFEYFGESGVGISSMLRVTTAEKQNIYYSFSFDPEKNTVAELTPHTSLSELYSAVHYDPNDTHYDSGIYYESEKLLFYADENRDIYAENKESGTKYLISSGIIQTEDDTDSITDDTADTSDIGGTDDTDSITDDSDVIGETESADPIIPETDTETAPDNADTEESVITEVYETETENYITIGEFAVYSDRYIIYELKDSRGIIGVGIFDADLGTDHFTEGDDFVSLCGNKVFFSIGSGEDIDHLYFITLDETSEYEFTEVPAGLYLDNTVSYSISPDGTCLAVLLKNPDGGGKEFLIRMVNLDSGESYEYYFTERPSAMLKNELGVWTEKYFITGSEETSELDSQLYMIPIK